MSLGLLATGWFTRGWYEDSQDLAENQRRTAEVAASLKRQAEVSQAVEDRLVEIRDAQRLINHGVIRELQNPVYHDVCLPDSGVGVLNSAAKGLFAREPTD